jgi:hypothetical protein
VTVITYHITDHIEASLCCLFPCMPPPPPSPPSQTELHELVTLRGVLAANAAVINKAFPWPKDVGMSWPSGSKATSAGVKVPEAVALRVNQQLWPSGSTSSCGPQDQPAAVALRVNQQLWPSGSTSSCGPQGQPAAVALRVNQQLWPSGSTSS